MSFSGTSIPRAITGRKTSKSNDTTLGMGRSFVFSSFKPEFADQLGTSPEVHSPDSVHEDTADLAEVGVSGDAEADADEAEIVTWTTEDQPDTVKAKRVSLDLSPSPNEPRQNSTTSSNLAAQAGPLPANAAVLHADSESLHRIYTSQLTYGAIGNAVEEPEIRGNVHVLPEAPRDEESLFIRKPSKFKEFLHNVRSADSQTWLEECVYKPSGYLPAVFLGALLNILDGLSYGMIMFPLSEEVFSGMAASGLSMFYVSTIISQLVFSLGGSSFKSAIGSEMIEVTPFFHQMAISVMHHLEGDDVAILATTMVTFALSSIVTGLCFFLLGRFRLGKLVGFFPRHILVGCVGGVGYFLFITGIEVCSRIDGGIVYNGDTLLFLFEPLVFLQWTIPLLMTVLLVVLERYIHTPLLVPGYIVVIFLLFHILVAAVPNWNLDTARDYGWVFEKHESNSPWYSFYELYKFGKVDWWVVSYEVPTMLALTFFGVLHVPINVPALALSIGMDEFDVDRELLAHGVSNAISGLVGSIQNYLVYTNSVLFIRAGADSRLSGAMLAVATCLVMFAGPGIIGFIPVCVVGTLIYLLGYELLKEALWDTIGRLKRFEYMTIIIIVITMGTVDFVIGILVGILLACVSFVVDAGSKKIVSGIYTGEYARSIVIRHPKQQEFLKRVGRQTCIFKLAGSLFFGSIGGLEEQVRARFEDDSFKTQPIKFLILDMNGVRGIDFSAAEGFRRIRKLLMEKECYLIISSVRKDSVIVRSLEDCGLWENEEHKKKIQLFDNLNSALEWCENKFLQTVRKIAERKHSGIPVKSKQRLPIALFEGGSPNSDVLSPTSASPRERQVLSAAQKSMKSERQQNLQLAKRLPSVTSINEPLPLILKVIQGLADKPDETLWNKLCYYLKKVEYKPGELIYNRTDCDPCAFAFESGLISYEMEFMNLCFSIKSSVLPLTLFGDLTPTNSERRIRYTATTDCVVWKLDEQSIQRLATENSQLYEELLKVYLRLIAQRADSITTNILVSS